MNPNRQKAAIVDMDGTLALLNGRDPYDERTVKNDLLNPVLFEVLQLLLAQGYSIVITTGRHEKSRMDTIEWLRKHGVMYSDLFMRPNDDNTVSGVKLKADWYDYVLKYKYDVVLAFDDMYQVCYMYRDRGVHAWQVNTDPFAKKQQM